MIDVKLIRSLSLSSDLLLSGVAVVLRQSLLLGILLLLCNRRPPAVHEGCTIICTTSTQIVHARALSQICPISCDHCHGLRESALEPVDSHVARRQEVENHMACTLPVLSLCHVVWIWFVFSFDLLVLAAFTSLSHSKTLPH